MLVRGSASFDLDGVEQVLTAPALVAITDPSVRRSAVAASTDAILIAVGRSPEGAFTSTWDERHTRDVPRHTTR